MVGVEVMEPALKYPEIRENLRFYAKDLADNSWINRISDKNSSDNIDYIIHFFFDDTSLSENPSGYIGLALTGEAEVAAVKRLTNGLDSLLNLYGIDLSDMDYLAKPEWKDIARFAKELLLLIDN